MNVVVKKERFGEIDSKTVYLYTLDNGNGLKAEITNYGCIIKSLCYKGMDVVLGRDSLEEYLNNSGYLGAVIGRNANRIGNAELEINGVTHKLTANQNGNNLHGGFNGFDKKVWDAQETDGKSPSLKLTVVSPDGDEGYPGEVTAAVTYTLASDNTLHIRYEGISDSDTALNMTNHSYFNLNGHDSGTILGHKLRMNVSFYTPNGPGCVPTGEILSVKGTPFDFLEEKVFGDNMSMDCEQLKPYKGFDHNFIVDGKGYRNVLELTGEKSGIRMQVFSDAPALQICAGNYIDENRVYKNGARYPKYSGTCIETQAFPNWNKFGHFPGGWLKKGEKYDTITSFKFL